MTPIECDCPAPPHTCGTVRAAAKRIVQAGAGRRVGEPVAEAEREAVRSWLRALSGNR